ncbi:DgyrCDS14565 [Dimorphilus gyrociliatus]|uniref:DgyrCDS14565 n=1 Tax=Dimorphilus gyrociliatus TaxID=2664684 RepID=A0A7I8WEB4_9ANNE|nr:DgyrCDS14565 [Dimorphilus gyrociliatus]
MKHHMTEILLKDIHNAINEKERPLEKIQKSHLIHSFERSIVNRFLNWARLKLINYSIGNIKHNFKDKDTGTDKNPLDVSCGKIFSGVNKKIIGGERTNIKNVPWQTFLLIKSEDKSVACGAIIIHPYYLLSAAHCVKRIEKYIFLAGIDDINKFSQNNTFYAEKVWIHEQYNTKTFENDIALFKITKEVQFNKYIQPICLPERDYGTNNNYHCAASGFGRISPTSNFK